MSHRCTIDRTHNDMSSRKRSNSSTNVAKRVANDKAAIPAEPEVAPPAKTVVEYTLHDVNSSNWTMVAGMQQTEQNKLLGEVPILMLTAIYSRSAHRCLIVGGNVVVYIILSGHRLMNGQFMYTLTNVSIDGRHLYGRKSFAQYFSELVSDAPASSTSSTSPAAKTPGVGMIAFRDHIRRFYNEDDTYSISALAMPDDTELHEILKFAGFAEETRNVVNGRDAVVFKYDAKLVKPDEYSAEQMN